MIDHPINGSTEPIQRDTSAYDLRLLRSQVTLSPSSARSGSKHNPTILSDDEPAKPDKTDAADASYAPNERRQRCRPVMRAKERKKQLDDMDSSQLQTQLTKIRKEKTLLNKEKKVEKEKRIALQKENRQLQAEVKRLVEKNQQWESNFDNDLLEERQKFAEARKAMQELIKNEKPAVLPDDFVREQYSKLLAECKAWVHEWCASKLDLKNETFLMNVLKTCVNNHDPTHVGNLFQELMKKQASAAKVLLLACVSRRVLHVFRNPFFLLESWNKFDEDVGKSFTEFNRVFKSDPWDVNKWRTCTSRILALAHESKMFGKDDRDSKFVQRKSREQSLQTIGELKSIFLRSLNCEIEEKNRLDQLHEIFLQSNELAIRLHSQQLQIVLEKKSYLFRQPFKIDSEYFEPHSSMGLDSDDHDHDGREISLLVTPLVKAVAHTEGNETQSRKVWLKAVVHILEDENPKRNSDSEAQITVDPKPHQSTSEDRCHSDKRRKMTHGQCTSEKVTPSPDGSEAAQNQNSVSWFDKQNSLASSTLSSGGCHINQPLSESTARSQELDQPQAKNGPQKIIQALLSTKPC